MPLLSIVIPNYNYGQFADRLFGSIARQSMSLEDVEIIFVDDGSSDDSLDRAAHWATQIPCGRFEISPLSRFGKPGPVRNHGLSLATGTFLLCLDADDSLHPDFFKECIETLEKAPDIDLVFTDYIEDMSDSTREVRLPKFNQAHLRTQNTLLSSAIYRRTLWDSGVRYRSNTEYEDWDYWVQCLMTGARFLHIPKPLFIYEMHSKNFSVQAQKQDGHAKAQIVLNNPSFFHPRVQEWAQGFMRGRMRSTGFPRGYIPSPADLRVLLKTVEQKIIGASGF